MEQDKQKLIEFFQSVQSLIKQLSEEGANGKLRLFPEKWRGQVRAALTQFRNDFNDGAAEASIRNALPDALKQEGLYGAQLEFKIQIVKDLFDRFKLRDGPLLLAQLLEAIDLLMESLIEALNLGEALKELLNFLRLCLQQKDAEGLKVEGWCVLGAIAALAALTWSGMLSVENSLLLIMLAAGYVVVRATVRFSKRS